MSAGVWYNISVDQRREIKMAYKDFVNDRKKGILKDVLLFYGAEDFLMNWAVESIVNDYVDESARDIDLIHLEGEQVTAADIMAPNAE